MRKAVAACLLVLLLLIPAAVLAESDLIGDGGFENHAEADVFGEWYYESWLEGGDETIAGVDESGVEGACAHIASQEANDARFCQTITVEPNSYYNFSCFIKTANIEGGAGANISVLDTFAASYGLLGTNDWQYVEFVGQTGAKQTQLTVCIRLGGYGALSSGEAWFDDFSMVKLDSFLGDAYSLDSLDASYYDAQQTQTDDSTLPSINAILLLPVVIAFAGLAVYQLFIVKKPRELKKAGTFEALLLPMLIIAILVRLITACFVYGHSTDMNCFMAWANILSKTKLDTFYTSGIFADYPPGYMYVLLLIGNIANLFGVPYGGTLYAILIKLPAILADAAAAYMIYSLAKKTLNEKMSFILACVVAFNPLMIFISGGWGQIDQILAVLLLAVVFLFNKRKYIAAGAIFGIAILLKPQALMAGPILAIAYFAAIADNKPWWKTTLKVLAAVVCAVAVIFLASLPFKGEQDVFWVLSKYFSTATSYPYASVEAFNLMALIGGNWTSASEPLFIFTYGQLGTVLIAVSTIFAAIAYLKGRKRSEGCLTMMLAFSLCAYHMLGQYMHERYLFPALLLILAAYAIYKDKRLFVSFVWLCAAAMFNALAAFQIVDHQGARGLAYDYITVFGSLLSLSGFGYFAYAVSDITLRGNIMPSFTEPRAIKLFTPIKLEVNDKSRFSKRDKLYCIILTAVYAAVALLNLGSSVAPETYWTGETGDYVRIEFSQEHRISKMKVFGGLYTGSIYVASDNDLWVTYDQVNDDMFRWKDVDCSNITTKSLSLTVTSGQIWLNEIAFIDSDGNMLDFTVDDGAKALCDEQHTVPAQASYLNGMYFDELYHARTAYEHLNGIKPYENSHPPLGKVFIMLGIALFGMNAFGWRIIGTLFGIGMVPIMYAFAKRLLKDTNYALLTAALFAFDFMHFTQTRIATIDVYGVFFIILMFYFIYRYYELNFNVDGLRKTLKPLALSGVFFALGAASKWICIYAGLGLAVLLFTSLTKRYIEYKRGDGGDAKVFWGNVIKTLLWCCVFFVALPVAVYLLSYIPYYLCSEPYNLEGVWGVQEFMFNYHSNLTDTHPYQSPWWQWPAMLRPIWYYVNYDLGPEKISTISAMGNPAVWWVCLAGTVLFVLKLIRRKIKWNDGLLVLLIGVAANFMPWMLISRATFIYHYFATVPFILLCTVYLVKSAEDSGKLPWYAKWIWLGAAIVLFGIFYPVISGLPCDKNYVKMLEWLPGWTFLGV